MQNKRKSWSKGLNKETNESIAKQATSIRNTLSWQSFGEYVASHHWSEPAFNLCLCNCGQKCKINM